MGKSHQKKQNYSQRRQGISENHKEKLPHNYSDHHLGDDTKKIQTFSSSNFQPSYQPKFKWVSRNSGAHVENFGSVPKLEVGRSSSANGPKPEVCQSSCEVGESSFDERESEVRERKRGDEEEKIEEVFELNEEGGGGGGVDDVVRRLEELQFGVEEVELSEEQINNNDQAQEDELLAMESIYGDSVYVLEKRQGLRSFQIHIHIELPSAYTVSAKFNADTHDESKSSNSDEFLYNFKVQYLSPIILTCLLPRSYPSHSPPSFIVSVQWLHESKISKLCSMLDMLWNEQPGLEILYQWVDWLHSSALQYLGFEEELLLGPYSIRSNSDRRALSGSISADVDIPSMKSYNEERQHENFLNGCHECCICFSEYAGTEFVRLPCHHFFCTKCMKTYADVHVKEGTVNKLQCPTTKCGGMIPPGLLKRLLGEEGFERWESLMLQKTLDSMSDVAYCPRCETACLEDEEQHALCSKCFFSFCTLCRDRRHVGVACMTPEIKLQFLQERQRFFRTNKDGQRRMEVEKINELLSLKEICRDAKQCPSCKVAISKTGGCNKMVCSNCGQYFCYRCNKAISGYEHFKEKGCELFPQEMIQQWEQRLNDRQAMGQLQANLYAANVQPCPNCRQVNAKVGNNNHIFCWACQNHFCFLCRKNVRRSSAHYGPRGCKQHTVG